MLWLRAAFRGLEGIVEDVAEVLAYGVDVLGRHVRRHVATPDREGPQVIDPVNVVRMDVRKPHGVDPRDARREELEPQLGRGVDEEAPMLRLDERAMARAPVARIVGRARRTVAPDHGDPEGGSGAEEGELHGPMSGRAGSALKGGRGACCSWNRTRGRGIRP